MNSNKDVPQRAYRKCLQCFLVVSVAVPVWSHASGSPSDCLKEILENMPLGAFVAEVSNNDERGSVNDAAHSIVPPHDVAIDAPESKFTSSRKTYYVDFLNKKIHFCLRGGYVDRTTCYTSFTLDTNVEKCIDRVIRREDLQEQEGPAREIPPLFLDRPHSPASAPPSPTAAR